MRVCVVVPTLNAGPGFAAVLDALARQTHEHDVLVVDSGSVDGTPDLARSKAARVHEIPNHEFGHGRTRNLACELAATAGPPPDVVAYLTQDAEPEGDWLERLLQPFALSPRIAAAFGRQVPRPGAGAPVRRELLDVARRLGPDDGIVVHGADLAAGTPTWAATFFTNVTSAVRVDALRAVPFRDVDYAEDQALAVDLHAAGYLTAYAPLAVVRHSHDYPLLTHFRRVYDDTAGLRESTGAQAKRGLARHVGTAAVLSARDAAVAVGSDEPLATRAWMVLVSPLYEVARRLAIALGRRRWPAPLHRRLSLEAARRRDR